MYTSKLRTQNDDDDDDAYRVYNRQDELNTIIYAFVLEFPLNGCATLSSVRTTQKVGGLQARNACFLA